MASDEAIQLLRSIDGTLKALLALSQRRTPAAAKEIAPDRDLDGKWGDPKVNFNPRDWSGDSFKNCRMSQCPAEFLEMLADTFDYFAEKAERTDERTDKGKPVADYKRKDAARARGWAKRAREGHKAAMTQAPAPAEPETDAGVWASDTDDTNDGWNVSADEVFARR